jgi:plastocyanin domain-containing protein
MKMISKRTVMSGIATAGIAFGIATAGAIAQESHEGMPHTTTEPSGEFQRIDQPLWLKAAITAGGLGFIGLELWWFLFSKPRSRQATTQGGIQEITVTVDGGYEPSQIVVQVGQPVRLNFDRKDPSSCLEEVRFPDFRIAQELPLNQITAIEFTPDKPGKYEFTCGMNMFRGIVEVQNGEPQTTKATTPISQPTHHPDQAIYQAEQAQHSGSQDALSSVEATMTPAGIQEATVTVAKGYQPKQVIVEAGHPVRLHFNRQNPSSCYDQLLIPEFAIAVDLAPNDTTTVEFTPEQAGEYEFMCGMKMNRGVVTVQPTSEKSAKTTAAVSQPSHHVDH